MTEADEPRDLNEEDRDAMLESLKHLSVLFEDPRGARAYVNLGDPGIRKDPRLAIAAVYLSIREFISDIRRLHEHLMVLTGQVNTLQDEFIKLLSKSNKQFERMLRRDRKK